MFFADNEVVINQSYQQSKLLIKMNENQLVSVIVPVYKVEQYLPKCIESIINQSYDNLEIILIDDGSPDNCPKICDEYAKIDSRIKVIHKKNGGLSDARNIGIDAAKGNYLYFVDSDDYIGPDSIKYLFNLIKKYNADIAIGGMCITYSQNESPILNKINEFLYDRISTLSEMMYNKNFNHSASAKLYKSSLFKGIRYPVGKLYEDLFTIYLVVNKADKIVFGTQYCYYYYMRPGSIMQSSFTSKNNDVIEGLLKLEQDIPINLYGLQKPFASLVVDCVTTLLEKNPRKNDIKEGWCLLKGKRAISILDKNATNRVRVKALLSYMGMSFLKKITHIYTKKRK